MGLCENACCIPFSAIGFIVQIIRSSIIVALDRNMFAISSSNAIWTITNFGKISWFFFFQSSTSGFLKYCVDNASAIAMQVSTIIVVIVELSIRKEYDSDLKQSPDVINRNV